MWETGQSASAYVRITELPKVTAAVQGLKPTFKGRQSNLNQLPKITAYAASLDKGSATMQMAKCLPSGVPTWPSRSLNSHRSLFSARKPGLFAFCCSALERFSPALWETRSPFSSWHFLCIVRHKLAPWKLLHLLVLKPDSGEVNLSGWSFRL